MGQTRVLSRCDLAREMHKLGVLKQELPVWVCIARYESKYNTSAIGRLNGNWSNDFGIFQISDRFWCVSSPNRTSLNLCAVDCKLLLSDDIRESVRCAQTVKKLQGWKAWAVYRACNRILPNVNECF
ncbi:lysozyme P-like [Teleopsis dalmanni]|uniref:lysozyme P-like n=1 Tax=Teleopsis dalmanni TaxID=139649 RepID=UPI0018CFA245|nr:lysozyme P-like [Teleopsis dalmanni]